MRTPISLYVMRAETYVCGADGEEGAQGVEGHVGGGVRDRGARHARC